MEHPHPKKKRKKKVSERGKRKGVEVKATSIDGSRRNGAPW